MVDAPVELHAFGLEVSELAEPGLTARIGDADVIDPRYSPLSDRTADIEKPMLPMHKTTIKSLRAIWRSSAFNGIARALFEGGAVYDPHMPPVPNPYDPA